MKIYILRHEDRTQDATFFAPLTKKGLENAVKLINTLRDENIDIIYSSPFIRTLQTVYPFAKNRSKTINLEYALAEIQHPHLIPEKSYQVSLPTYIAESFNYNSKYTSTMEPENHIYPEDEKNVTVRVKKLLNKIVNENVTSRRNILLVSHQAVCNAMLKIATKDMTDVNIEYTYNYPRGGVTRIFNQTEWEFKPINWKE